LYAGVYTYIRKYAPITHPPPPWGEISASVLWVGWGVYEKGKRKGGKCNRKRKNGERKENMGSERVNDRQKG
jgi:hypothetical protein